MQGTVSEGNTITVGSSKKTVRSEVDLIKEYKHEVRVYYRTLAKVGLSCTLKDVTNTLLAFILQHL